MTTIRSAKPLSWVGILQLGLVQASLGAVAVFVTSTLNRIMAVEYALPAVLPGALIALHYAVQFVRPRYGYESDRRGRRTPWIVGGMGAMAASAVLCAAAVALLPVSRVYGIALAALGYLGVGAGVGAAGTSLLVLVAQRVEAPRRAAAATVLWILMVAGFAITSTLIGRFLDPFSAQRLMSVAIGTAIAAFCVACLALVGVETPHLPSVAAASKGNAVPRNFKQTLRSAWSDPDARRFTLFVFLSMLAYSAQELLLEPFAGLILKYSVGESAKLAGLQHAAVFVGMLTVGIACSSTRRYGSLRLWTIGGCWGSAIALASLVVALSIGPPWPFRFSIAALGMSNGVFAIGALGSMMELAHRGSPDDAGTRMGLWGAAQAMAFAFGGLLSTVVVDTVRYVFGSAIAAFSIVFTLEAGLFLVAASYVLRPRRPLSVTLDTGPIQI